MSIEVKQLSNGVKRYASAIRQIFAEGFSIAKWPVFLTIVFDILTLISQTGALVTLAQIPRYISFNAPEVSKSLKPDASTNALQHRQGTEAEKTVSALEGPSLSEIEDYFFSFSPDVFIPIIIGCSFLALLFTTISRYFATYFARKCARKYHQKIVSDCYGVVSGSEFWRFGSQQATMKDIQFTLVQYSIHVSQAFERLLRLTPVIIALPTGAYIALSLQPLATSILFVLAFVLVPGTLLIGRRIHRNASSFFELEAVDFNGALTRSIQLNLGQSLASSVSTRDEKLQMMDRPFKSFLNSYDLLQLSSAQMMFITGVLRAVIFLAVLIILYLIVYQKSDFAAVAVYGSVLYIILNTAQSALSVVANLNVYAPQVFKYLVVRDKLHSQPIQPDSENEVVSSLHDQDRLFVDAFSYEPFSRAGYHGYLPYLAKHFQLEVKTGEIFVFPTVRALEVDGYSFNELAKAFKEKTGLILEEFLVPFDNGNQISSWLDNTSDRKDQKLGSLMHLQTRLRFAFMICLASVHGARIIEIPSQHFPKLSESDYSIFNVLAEQFVLVRRAKPGEGISEHAQLVCLVNESQVSFVRSENFKLEMLNELQKASSGAQAGNDAVTLVM